MNELILQDLMNQSYIDVDKYNNRFSPEKFAQLIVRECLMKVNGAKIRNESYDELISRITVDFGVEL